MTGMADGIVAGYDGSPGGGEALRWAAGEARARGTVLTVCLACGPDRLALPSEPAVRDVVRQRAQEVLERGLRHAEPIAGAGRVRQVLTDALAAPALCERSGTAEMVVVGSHGHGGLAGSLLGPVAWQVANHATGRVVIVRGTWRPVGESAGPVVAGVDGSAGSRAAIGFAVEEAALRDVPVVALCALADTPGRLGEMRQIEEDFSRLVTSQEKEHPEVTVLRQVVAGPPRSSLLSAAAGAQLLVLGARGRGGLAGMSLGSIADAALQHAPCPVEIVRPQAAQS